MSESLTGNKRASLISLATFFSSAFHFFVFKYSVFMYEVMEQIKILLKCYTTLRYLYINNIKIKCFVVLEQYED